MYARLACLVLCSLAVVLPEGVYAQDFYYGVTNAIRKNTQNLITSGVKFPEGIAIDESARKIYWVEADPDNPAIRRANLDGTGVQTVISTEITTPRGLALDVPRGKMYWVDVGEDKLFRANLNGSGRETLFWLRYVPGGSPRFPTGVALDLSGGRVYWTDANTGRIYRSPLDGCSLNSRNEYPCLETVVTGVQQALLGLAVDPGGGKIYWAEDGSNRIKRANLNGTGIETVVSGLDKPYGLALDLTDRKLY